VVRTAAMLGLSNSIQYDGNSLSTRQNWYRCSRQLAHDERCKGLSEEHAAGAPCQIASSAAFWRKFGTSMDLLLFCGRQILPGGNVGSEVRGFPFPGSDLICGAIKRVE
jgi:hypothetical protein